MVAPILFFKKYKKKVATYPRVYRYIVSYKLVWFSPNKLNQLTINYQLIQLPEITYYMKKNIS